MKTETEIREEIEGLRSLTTRQLKQKYREVFGEESRSNHKQFLFRRIAWRIQANAWGGLSERARQRALKIADDADLRIRAPKNFLREPLDNGRTTETRLKPSLDPRSPSPGTPLIRHYQSKDILVHMANRDNATGTPMPVRCAIYTRKSTDEGLNQDLVKAAAPKLTIIAPQRTSINSGDGRLMT
ncbi:MAG: DUF2924 domain-containing protein [Bryobacteraceae bacterium]|nr:DUF2924 domain-containing protein [Bryobacteraceae bacterium]